MGTELEKRLGDILRERYLHKVVTFPHVRDLFKRLREDGIKVALASSAKEAELAFYKRVAGVEDLVDVETFADVAEKATRIRTSSKPTYLASISLRRTSLSLATRPTTPRRPRAPV